MSSISINRARLISRAAMAVLLVGCMVAASTPVRAQRAAAPVTITYWQQWIDPVSKSAWKTVIALFEKSHPDIRVQEVDISSDQKILTAITGGKPPDAATMWTLTNLGEWAARGAIQNLDPMIKAHHLNLSSFSPSSLGFSTYKGHLYGLPIEIDDDSLVINLDAFKAAGLRRYPRTMSELAADAVKLTRYDSAGHITQLGLSPGGQGVITLAPDFNGTWYNAATRTVTPDSPGVLQALQWLKALVDKYGVQAFFNFQNSKAHNPVGEHFIDGNVAMSIGGEWYCSLVPAYNKKVHFVVLPPPYADGHPAWQNSTPIGGSIDVIPTGAAHPEQAFQFIQFVNSVKAQVILNQTFGNIPVVKGAIAAMSHGCMKPFIDLAFGPRGFAFPVLPVANDYRNAIFTAQDKVLHGQATPQQAMAQVKQQIQAALNTAQ